MLELELFRSRLNRTIAEGDLVGVHWNKHQNVWSIVGMKSRKGVGLVMGYADEITLEDVTFHIDKTKQRGVRETGAKDRHAFIVGKVVSLKAERSLTNELYYNPFKVNSFVDKDDFMINGENTEELEHVQKASLFSVGEQIMVRYV